MKMTSVLFLLLIQVIANGQNIYRCDNGTVQFKSEAELELIKASSEKLIGVIDTARNIFAFAVDINSFDGFNAALQKEHFNENYLESNKFRNATFSGKIIEDIDFGKEGIYTVRTKGALKIHGIEQERIIKCTIKISQGKIMIESNFSVFLKDHNIKVPKVVHENIAAQIEVNVKAEMKSYNK